jgi:Fe-S-cluster containining protein
MRYDFAMARFFASDGSEERAREVSSAVARILAAADADIAARRPVCNASGRCCHFEAWGHRLYVTAAEVMHFARVHVAAGTTEKPGNAKSVSLPQFFARDEPEGCPYQVDNLCTAREARPLGCRVYFCDANNQSWQNDVYEKYHAQLKALHEAGGLPYRYLEWRTALRELTAPAAALG